MQTRTATSTSQPTPPPTLLFRQLLITERSVTNSTPTPMTREQIKARATEISIVLKDILEQPGYRHGGLNE